MLLLLLITYFYCRSPKLSLKTQRAFFVLLIFSNLCTVADILSILAIYKLGNSIPLLVDFICKLYLVLLISVSYCGLRYILADIYSNDAQFFKKNILYVIVLVVAILLIGFMPIQYFLSEDGGVVYSYGPATIVTYIFAIVTIISIFIHLYAGRKRIHPRRRVAVMVWFIIWGLAAVIQFLDARLLVVTYAGVMGVGIIFTMIENPESNIDKQSGFFNNSALTQYMTEAYSNAKPFLIICTSFNDEQTELYREFRHGLVFVGGGDIFLIYKDAEFYAKALDILKRKLHNQMVYAVPDSGMMLNQGELFAALKEAQKLPGTEQKDNLYIIDEALLGTLKDKKDTQQLIQDAIENDRIEVFYQPIYSTEKNSFCSAEALMRIRGEDGGLIMPGRFIPVAEDDGSIVKLGKILFDKVCAFLARNREDNLGLQYIEVNLSVVQGENRNLTGEVMDIMKLHGIETDKINLEITESASVRGKEQLMGNMRILQEVGVGFSLDDFGTGQSNLDYIASMPVELVKFDRSMTQGYFESEKTRHIMRAAINMVHEMGMKVVAEGIETEEQLDSMKELKVEYIQGFYFSKPVPEDEFKRFLIEHNYS